MSARLTIAFLLTLRRLRQMVDLFVGQSTALSSGRSACPAHLIGLSLSRQLLRRSHKSRTEAKLVNLTDSATYAKTTQAVGSKEGGGA